ncbi:MAG: rod shape-determining protein [Rickettsiales bacterium]|jgi:rod shape-determining protein MreB|nr:rod shape-determining protein [Rickettsiales bacterium]
MGFFSIFAKDIGIDLGTANTVICSNNEIVLNEPSVVALVEKGGMKVPYTFGMDAKQMLGKTPLKIDVIRPMKDGVIADFSVASEMIRYFISKILNNSRYVFGPVIIICVPSGSTTVERRAIQEAAESVGARDVWLIEEPMAAAIGTGLPILESIGSMCVGIGGGTLEVGVIALGGLVYGNSLRLAGDKMDTMIMDYVRNNFSLLIGETTAEKVKMTIGSALPPEDGGSGLTMKIRGRSLTTGIPTEIDITEKDVADSLQDSLKEMVGSISTALQSIPPELSSDISERGIILSGGGALLKKIDVAITNATGLKVTIAEDPLFSVVNGINIVMNNFNMYKNVLFKQH